MVIIHKISTNRGKFVDKNYNDVNILRLNLYKR